LATSDTSARVGREFSIIESSICVATITGLAFSRQSCTACFCTSGTWSSGSSTPRSPRATITPSNASTIASSWRTASGFSTLARTGRRMPTSSMIARTSLTSSGARTNDSATRSTPRSRAKRRSSASFSDSAGTLTATLGTETPLLSETGPPSTTRTWMSGPSTDWTSTATLPSSIRSRSPGFTSAGRFA
jgi:hypothetical protein